jgi:uncharacterized membrane protein
LSNLEHRKMAQATRVLIAGESWTTHSIHQKGFDSFTTTEYSEGVGWLRAALESGGWRVDYQPSHVAARDFPATASALAGYNCVILSDIGANTLLIHPDTFTRFKALSNRLDALRDYVAQGGGLIMIGGYLSFQGVDGKARYHDTPIEVTLPVTIETGDDRRETPQGVTPKVALSDHPIVAGLASSWPVLLGYNRFAAKPGAAVIANVGADPLLVAGAFENGRAVAFASDCGPHWAPPGFIEWSGYAPLWCQMAGWAAGRT